jgi:beta-lactamase regulating signal transducer with metallopeptidase domain
MINIRKSLFHVFRKTTILFNNGSIRTVVTKPKRNIRGDVVTSKTPKSKPSKRYVPEFITAIKPLLTFTAVGSFIVLTVFLYNFKAIMSRLRGENRSLDHTKSEMKVVSLDEKYRNYQNDIVSATSPLGPELQLSHKRKQLVRLV